jgi:hypothetical protein
MSILFKSIRHIKQRALSNSLELLWFFLPALPSIVRCYINLPSFVFLLVLPFLRYLESHILELSSFYRAPNKERQLPTYCSRPHKAQWGVSGSSKNLQSGGGGADNLNPLKYIQNPSIELTSNADSGLRSPVPL